MSISSNVVPRYSIDRRGHDLEIADLLLGVRAGRGSRRSRRRRRCRGRAAAALVEHRERLADAGRGAEIDAQRPAGHRVSLRSRPTGRAPRLSSSTLTSARPARRVDALGCSRRSSCSTCATSAREPSRPGAPAARVRHRDLRVEARRRRRHRVDRHLDGRREPVLLAVRRGTRCFTVASKSGLVGPEVRPGAVSWLRSFGSLGTVLLSSFGSAASEPLAAAPAALGRPWKYFGFVKFWPISYEPTTLPFTSTSEPFGLVRDRDLRDRR